MPRTADSFIYTFFSATVNCFIHILMYSYYFLSALGPWIQPYLWWKRYLTSLQLIQFFLVMIHAVCGLISDCKFPHQYIYALLTYLISHIILFSNFYRQNYHKPKKVKGHKNDSVTQEQNGNERYHPQDKHTPRSKDE